MTAPSIDLSEFYRLSAPRKPPCRLGHAMTQLKSAERHQIEAAVAADPGIITNAAIEKWLSLRDQAVSVSAIVSHRKKTCTCADA